MYKLDQTTPHSGGVGGGGGRWGEVECGGGGGLPAPALSIMCVQHVCVKLPMLATREREREEYIYTCDDSAVSDTAALKIS